MTAAMGNLGLLAAATGGWDPLWDGLLSAGFFAAVWTAVVAVFGYPGKPRLSPQREAALATGHIDRRTVFEYPLLRPILWLVLSLAHRLAIPRTKAWLHRKLVAAGSPNYYTAEEYLALAISAGVALAVIVGGLHVLAFGHYSVLWPVLALAAGVGLTLYQLVDRAGRRTQDIGRRLPYALDLIALAMGAGATFVEAAATITRQQGDDPFNVELKAMLAEMDLGTTRRAALLNLARRVPLEALQTVVASIIQAEELGTPLGQVLHDQATLLRLHRSVRAENAAAVASVRILIPGLLLVVASILTVFGSMIVRALRGGLF
jgi:tight adherence protein C